MSNQLNKKELAAISFIEATVLGIAYVYLFLWKPAGISYLIYFVLVFGAGMLPIVLFNPERLFKKRSLYLLLLPVLILLAAIFTYRLNPGWLTIAFITLPVLWTLYFTSLHVDNTLKNFRFWDFLLLPLRILASWFPGLAQFVKNFKLWKLISDKDSSNLKNIRKVAFGFFIAIPFALFFLLLLTSADEVFSSYVSEIWLNTFGTWFANIKNLSSLIGKLVTGIVITAYFTVFQYSLWDRESVLHKWMEKNKQEKLPVARDWDAIVSSSFLFTLNLIFVAFVLVQFVYLFGGVENVLGNDATLTYAEYARRGFWELLAVSIIAYLIILALNLKVKAESALRKLVFYANSSILILSVIVMTFSSHTRLSLYESVYGFTTLRLFVHFVTVCIAILYFALLVSPFFKKTQKFMSIVTSILLFSAYVILLVTPGDYIVAKLNYQRFQETEDVDLKYMMSLSNEAFPVLIDMAEDSPEDMKYVILSELEDKYDSAKDERNKWMSFNISHYRNLEEFEKYSDTDWDKKAEDNLSEFVQSYLNTVENEDFDEAYEEYWSKDLERSNLENYADDYDLDIASYRLVDEFSNQPLWSYYGQGVGLSRNVNVEVELNYKYKKGGFVIETHVPDSVGVRLENGEWKVYRAHRLVLGEASDDGGRNQIEQLFYGEE